jgi:hypothetical protein
MPRHPITCVWSSGDSFGATRGEAEELVRDGFGEWDGSHIVRLQDVDRSGGRLSARFGKYLANMVRRGQPWARVMLNQIER